MINEMSRDRKFAHLIA